MVYLSGITLAILPPADRDRLMAALGAIPGDALSGFLVIGELNLDGTIAPIAGALPAAIAVPPLQER